MSLQDAPKTYLFQGSVKRTAGVRLLIVLGTFWAFFLFWGEKFWAGESKSLIFKNLERATGIEPVTSSLGSWHSTAELRPLSAVS